MNDTLEEMLAIKKEITSSFKSYDEFAAWLLAEQEAAKHAGKPFQAA